MLGAVLIYTVLIPQIRRAPGIPHDKLVQRGDGMARAKLSGVLSVVFEILVLKQSVSYPTRRYSLNLLRVEFNLNLNVFGDGIQEFSSYRRPKPFRLADIIYIGVIAVALVSESFHSVILVVAHAEAQNTR